MNGVNWEMVDMDSFLEQVGIIMQTDNASDNIDNPSEGDLL